MKNSCVILVLVLMFGAPQGGNAQILNKLKNAAVNNKDKLKKLGNSLAEDLKKARDEFDSTDFDYAILLSDNASYYNVKKKNELSAKITTSASIGSNIYNNQTISSEEHAKVNIEMGELAYATRKFSYAEKRYKAAQRILEENNATASLDYVKTVSNLSLLYSATGRYSQAEVLNDIALASRMELFGEENPSVAASYNNAGVIHHNMARYHDAELSFEKAEEIVKKNNSTAAMPYAVILNNKAMLYQSVGRYEDAISVLKKSIEIAELHQGEKSKKHLKLISNLALLYQQLGDYENANSIYKLLEKKLGKKHPDKANMYSNWAALSMIEQKYEEAESKFLKSRTIFKESFGTESPAYAKATADLGNYYRVVEQYDKSLPLLNEALSVRKKALGEQHPKTVESEESLALYLWKNNAIDDAAPLYTAVMHSSLDFVNSYFPPMSEAEKTKYWDVLYPRFQRYQNFALDYGSKHPEYLKEFLEFQMATKALLLNSTNKIKKTILGSEDEELIQKYSLWLDQKEGLSRLYAYSKKELEEQNINLDSIENATNALEKELSAMSTAFADGYAVNKTTYTAIKNEIEADEALVEVIRIRNYEHSFTGAISYAFLVLTKEKELPQLVLIQDGKLLEERYFKYYRNVIQAKAEDEYSYDQFWLPLNSTIQNKKSIYISLDGIYNQISLNSLSQPGSEPLLIQYDISLLGNAKDLISVKNHQSVKNTKNISFVGFPDFQDASISALPGTKTEIEGINAIVAKSGYKYRNYLKLEASEANLKQLPQTKILHIATHGFFMPDVESSDDAFGVHMDNAQNNPLLRSGLLLAGVGAQNEVSPDLASNDNGVLTAYEAMNLDLEGTEMVVLSACETGLGDVKDGEGVYGLQRSFIIAGAETVVMSLWKVDDQATQQLMQYFYSNLMRTDNKKQSFKKAQMQLRTKYPEPYYWGAFVLIGK